MFKRMIELKAKVKSWGNSLGIILPKSTGIKENQDVVVHITPARRMTRVKDILGRGKLVPPSASRGGTGRQQGHPDYPHADRGREAIRVV